jgi:plasmid stabilization system protein ParE
MKPLEFHPQASEELIDSAQFFEGASSGLGDRFLDALHALMGRIESYPSYGAPTSSRRTRVARVSGFPYDVIYRDESSRIYVVAIAHQSRKPGYWKGRI